MKNSIFLKFTLCIFTLAIFMTSCFKENVDEVEQVVEPFTPVLAITMNGVTTNYDAFASYCVDDDGTVYATVSTHEKYVDDMVFEITTDDLQPGEFVMIYTKPVDENGEAILLTEIPENGFEAWHLGGVTPTFTVIDNTEISGSADGSLESLFTGNQVPVSIDFNAEVVAANPNCQ